MNTNTNLVIIAILIGGTLGLIAYNMSTIIETDNKPKNELIRKK